ncbi:MAG: class IV adenylate cyclase [Terriglobia bacterium]
MRTGEKETEVKLAVSDVAQTRRRVRALGFGIVQRRSFERNTLFDTAGKALSQRNCLVRLRSVNGRHWLTFKGPARGSQRYKVRREFETELTDAGAAARILAGLGLRPVFRYEKFRTVYAAEGRWRGGEVMLDETPIGAFLELEGPPPWIRRVARALGAGRDRFITSSYATLYWLWCQQRGRPGRNMVFPRRRLSP